MAHKSPDLVSFLPLRRVLENWLATSAASDPISAFSLAVWPGGDEGNGRLSKLMAQDTITFDLADRILTRLNLNHLWLEDPELREIYEGIDLTWLDFVKPTCEQVDKRNRRIVAKSFERNAGLMKTARELRLSAPQVRRLLAAA